MKLFRDRELERDLLREVGFLQRQVDGLTKIIGEVEQRQVISGSGLDLNTFFDDREFMEAKQIAKRFNEIYSALKMERVTEPGTEPKTLLKKKV